MSLDETLYESIQPFIDKGLISDVLLTLKSGKEATVFACRGGERMGGRMLAVKVYRPAEHRHFRNDSAYRAGRVILNERTRRAVESRSDFGREAAFGMWVGAEWEYLRELHSAGVDVPRPIDRSESAIVMEYIGDRESPAPQLRSVRLTEAEARGAWDRVVWNVRRMMQINRIHGDLSPYNILWHAGRPVIIDVPQMADPRMNPNAREMLARDLENTRRHFAKYADGLSDPWRTADGIWHRWKLGEM